MACFTKIREFHPKMDGEFMENLIKMDDFGGTRIFGNTNLFVSKWNYDVRATCVSVRSFRGGRLLVGRNLEAVVMAKHHGKSVFNGSEILGVEFRPVTTRLIWVFPKIVVPPNHPF